MASWLWDFVVDSMIVFFYPLICTYYSISGNLFLNTASPYAEGLEKTANVLLIPFQYLFDGQSMEMNEEGTWIYSQRFDYSNHFWEKTTLSLVALPVSITVGGTLKTLCYILFPKTREQYAAMKASFLSPRVSSNMEKYRMMGMAIGERAQAEWFPSEGHARRPGDEKHLEKGKMALRDITNLLSQAQIPWWVDCGTCLGAYRYGGIIPWDDDIDIAVLMPDFDNVRRALLDLDSKKYLVQDWSGRLNPYNFFKVYIRETGTRIDIYHFDIEPIDKRVRYFLTIDTCSLYPEWVKIRERRFTVPASFSDVFPLKKALFDGIEVFVPQNPKKYLQRCYGENLAPAKIYNPNTCQYEKDLTHPYWQRAYVH